MRTSATGRQSCWLANAQQGEYDDDVEYDVYDEYDEYDDHVGSANAQQDEYVNHVWRRRRVRRVRRVRRIGADRLSLVCLVSLGSQQYAVFFRYVSLRRLHSRNFKQLERLLDSAFDGSAVFECAIHRSAYGSNCHAPLEIIPSCSIRLLIEEQTGA